MIKKVWTIGRVIVESAVVAACVIQLTIGSLSHTGAAVAKYDGCVSQGEQTELRLANRPQDTTGG